MKKLLLAVTLMLSTPAVAEITTSIDARFGVGYRSDPSNAQSNLQSLYEGRFTTSITHQADNGLQFRFDLGVVIGNIDTPRPRDYPALPNGSQFGLD